MRQKVILPMHSLNSKHDMPVQPNGRHVVGIDIGQQHHAAAALTSTGLPFGRDLAFKNNRAGVEALERSLLVPLGGPTKVLIAMEATGHYWMPLYFQLTQKTYQVVVINPIQTRAQFRSRIRKTKTDKLDAKGIARFLLNGEAKAARVPSEATFELRLLTRQRWKLVGLSGDLQRFLLSLADRIFPEYPGLFSHPLIQCGRELIREYGLSPQAIQQDASAIPGFLTDVSRNKLKQAKINALLSAASSSIGISTGRKVIVEQLKSTLAMIDSLDAQIAEIDNELKVRVAALQSPLASLGLQAPLIATIHAESDPMSDFAHVWQYEAYTGLDPSTNDSGKMHGTRNHISKRGSPYLRQALYLAAFALYRKHKDLMRLYQKFRKTGRHHVEAMVNVAHKLARIVWRLLTDNRDFKARPPSRRMPAAKQN